MSYVGRVNGATTCSCLQTRNDGWLSGKRIKLQSKRAAPWHAKEGEKLDFSFLHSPPTFQEDSPLFPSHASHRYN